MARSSSEILAFDDLAQRKARVAAIQERARTLFVAGTPGIPIAVALSEMLDRLLLDFVDEALGTKPEPARAAIAESSAIVAIGGTGRGEVSPYSDVDLLFLDGGSGSTPFRDCATQVVQYCWDAKLGLGHSVRTVADCIALSRSDCEVATSLVEARLLWGSPALFDKLKRQFQRHVVDARRRAFVEDCLAARAKEFPEPGQPALELEPNVKRSLGGLRDMHLIRWLGFALFGASDLDALRLKGALSVNEARIVRTAWEFLTRIRIDMHLAAGKAQDLLTRDEQLRITKARGIEETTGQRAVERFMQQYFRHSQGLAAAARRFAARHRPRSAWSRASSAAFSHRAEGVLRVTTSEIDAPPRHFERVCGDMESALRLYRTAAMYGLLPSARLLDAVETSVRGFTDELTPRSASLFMDILRCRAPLGMVLRSMYDVGLLERIIPEVRHARCLMQFNQYHHYTVDEHSLRAVEAASRLQVTNGPVGAVYEAIRHKELLHLALLLHDLGKGFDEHHWDVGRRIAQRTVERLGLSTHDGDLVVFLVYRHLEMSHYALRRDISDPELQLQFSHLAGSPEALSMLYVLTAADITAVGPGAWTGWKEELLTELYNRCQMILAGTRDGGRVHMEAIRRDVVDRTLPLLDLPREEAKVWTESQLDRFSDYYLTCTSPSRIAADLRIVRGLTSHEVSAQGRYDQETATSEYRVITRDPRAAEGCFHKLTGVLAAKRLEILSADISTSRDGLIIDSFRVLDRDFEGAVPDERMADVSKSIESVLHNRIDVKTLFQRHRRYGSEVIRPPISNLPIRVEVDNDSSDTRTVIDVFAHDRPGLLYWVARTLYDLKLSVELARISTHYDQVVDVFYVRELDGRKVQQAERLETIRSVLTARLEEFDRNGIGEVL